MSTHPEPDPRLDSIRAQLGPYYGPHADVLGSLYLGFRVAETPCDATELAHRVAALDALADAIQVERRASIRKFIHDSDVTAAELARILGVSRQAATKQWGPAIRYRDSEARRADLVTGDRPLPL